MPFNGSGTFLRLYSWVMDATNSVKIRADRHDDEDNNFAAGLSSCITRDGQTVITQNIPLNSRRIISLADPIDPQDAATKDYADTKAPLAGGVPFTGDVVVNNDDPTFTLNGKDGFGNAIYGQKNDKNRWAIVLGDATAETGGNAGSNFYLTCYADDGSGISQAITGVRATGRLSVNGDPTAALGIVTKQYADATAVNAAASKLPLTGGTITGALTVNGEFVVSANYVRFGTAGGVAHISWNGGSSYSLGGAGTIWHSGNFTPATYVSDGRLALAGQNGATGSLAEPYPGGVITGANNLSFFRWRYMQLFTTSWYTIGYYG